MVRRPGQLAALGLVLLAANAAAQSPPCTAPVIASPDELRAALDALPGAPNAEQRAAAIAMLGVPVVGWALDVATDSSGAVLPETRAAALRVLRYARWKAAMDELMALAQPFHGPWVVWRSALHALTTYPFAELTPYWLDLVRFPRRVVREDALLGLSTSADPTVLPMVREATRHEEDPAMLELAAHVERRLRTPVHDRDTLVFAGAPDSTGRFIPSRAWLARARCDRQPGSR